MPASFDTPLGLAVLGPLFPLAGVWRHLGPREHMLQGRTWCTVGAVFSAVALLLLLPR